MEKAENRILEILNKKGRLRHGELQRIIVDQEKICAKRTFDKALQQLCSSCKLIRNETSKQHVWYETLDFSKKKNNINQYFDSQLEESKKYLNIFLKNESKLDDEQKAEFIIHLYGSIEYLDKMIFSLQSLSDLKKTKVVDEDMIENIKEFSEQINTKCSKFISEPSVSQYIMSIKGKQYSMSLVKIHKILDSLPQTK